MTNKKSVMTSRQQLWYGCNIMKHMNIDGAKSLKSAPLPPKDSRQSCRSIKSDEVSLGEFFPPLQETACSIKASSYIIRKWKWVCHETMPLLLPVAVQVETHVLMFAPLTITTCQQWIGSTGFNFSSWGFSNIWNIERACWYCGAPVFKRSDTRT